MAAGRNNMVASQHHQHQHNQQQQQHQPGWSKKSSFNFRFTDKSQSAPSLPCSVSESAYHDSLGRYSPFGSSKTTVFENYTRVASVPVDLNLCGSSTNDVLKSCQEEDIEMADVTVIQEESSRPILESQIKKLEETIKKNEFIKKDDPMKKDDSIMKDNSIEKDDLITENDSPKALQSSVRTQDPQSVETKQLLFNETPNCQEEEDLPLEDKPVTSTVKTQDRIENVLEIAMAMENDVDAVVDEAIKQFKREVKEATAAGNTSEVIAAMETVQRLTSSKQRQRVKNNASYELAQQYEVNEKNLRSMPSCQEDEEENRSSLRRSASGRRVLNNASYELAQQCDFIKAVQTKPFLRMDACDEIEESRVADLVQKIGQKKKQEVNEEKNSLLGQIKKNSDLFLVYGEDGSYGEEIRCRLDDEVDYPCLENKPIQYPEQGIVDEVRNEEMRKEVMRKKSFISEHYPEKTRQGEENGARSAVGDQRILESDRRTGDGSGERLWRVVVEKQSVEKQLQKEKGAEASEKGHSVHRVHDAGSPPPEALEARRGSGTGNPAVAVGVDRNEVRVRDNDNKEHKRPVLNEMSTVAKRLAGASTAKGDTVTVMPERKKGGLGGFLQRFSKLRFSGRSKVPRSEVQKKSEQVQQVSRVRAEEPQMRRQEPDYIIIPLHPTEEEKRAEEIRTEQEAAGRTLKRPADVERSTSSVR